MESGPHPPTLYGTKQVAELLDIPEWRVKNFAEGEAYGFSPSHRIGSGRGSRRLYSYADVLRLAVANELVNCGFSAESVGRAIREIPESTLTKFWEAMLEPVAAGKPREKVLEYLPFLILSDGQWRVNQAKAVKGMVGKALKNVGGGKHGLFILDLVGLVSEVTIRRVRKPNNALEKK